MKNTTTFHHGTAVPLDRDNIDTDQIIPKQFLKSIKKSGFGPNLFDAWRYEDEGFPGQDISQRKLNEDFILENSGQDEYLSPGTARPLSGPLHECPFWGTPRSLE